VHYEWIKTPDNSGFGSYPESGPVVPARPQGEPVNLVAQMYLDDDPPIAAGGEIWGGSKKYAHPALEIVKDTLTGPGVDGRPEIAQLVAINLTDIVVKGSWIGPVGCISFGAHHFLADVTVPYGQTVYDYNLRETATWHIHAVASG
jgi:acetoacetate decarboxylase